MRWPKVASIRLSLLEGEPRFGWVRYCAGSAAIHCWPFEIKLNWGKWT